MLVNESGILPSPVGLDFLFDSCREIEDKEKREKVNIKNDIGSLDCLFLPAPSVTTAGVKRGNGTENCIFFTTASKEEI